MQILAGIILLGVLVTFHELGHFLFAKWLGVRVLVFSVGFGPKIFGFKRGETEYRLSAIPLGGYVRMFGESLEEELTPEEKKMSFMHQAIWRKSLIAVAGPLFNFILPIILFFFLLVGVEQVFSPRVGTLLKDGVAEKAGIRPDDLITAVQGKSVASFNEVADFIAMHPNQDVNLRIKRKNAAGQLEDIEITVRPEAKLSSNPLEKDQAVGRIGIMPAIVLPMVTVNDESSLRGAGLQSFDEIKKIDGQDIQSQTALLSALSQLKPGSNIEVERSLSGHEKPTLVSIVAPANFHDEKLLPKPTKVTSNLSQDNELSTVSKDIDRTKVILNEEQSSLVKYHGVMGANGSITEITKDSVADHLGLNLSDRIVAVDGEPMVSSLQLQQAIVHNAHAPHVLGVLKHDGTPLITTFSLPAGVADRVGLNSDLLGLFGIKTAQVFKSGDVIERRVSLVEALKRASMQTMDIAVMTAKSMWLLVKREVPASQIGGPIMLFDVAQQAAQKGLSYYIFIMCLLSVNLGLLNLLPIPALDGGHLLLFGIEAIQRKPLTAKTRGIATQIGIAILLLIMAFAIFND